MNKKGFTLIELLAVIVILAIIALIATPIVLNIIDDAKKESELRSAEFYLKSLELSIAQATLDGYNIQDGVYNILGNGNICLEKYEAVSNNKYECNNDDVNDAGNLKSNELIVEVKGKVPTSGTIAIANGQIGDISLTLDNKEIVKDEEGNLKYKEDVSDSPNIPETQLSCFTYEEVSNTITITGYTCGVSQGGTIFDVAIPKIIDGKPVTVIADYSFPHNGLTSVILPDSIITIGSGAFGYNDLSSITIPSSVKTIKDAAFIDNNIKSITIPSSVETLMGGSFLFNNLESVIIKGKSSLTEFEGIGNVEEVFGWADGYSNADIEWK